MRNYLLNEKVYTKEEIEKKIRAEIKDEINDAVKNNLLMVNHLS